MANDGITWITRGGKHIPIGATNDYMNNFIRNKKKTIKEKRLNEHTLEYNGYYIMSPAPNVGYKYETLEEAPYFSIYDANNDDITHNIANWVSSIEKAKEYIDDMKKVGILK